MGINDPASKTMRIDIHPDFLGESLKLKKQTAISQKETEPRVIITKRPRKDRSPEYERLLESIYDAAIITNMDGRIGDYNTRALDFFFARPEQLVGINIIELISGANNSLLDSIIRNLRDHKYTLIDGYCRRRDGSLFPSEIAVNQIMLDNKGHLCFFIRDVTVRKKQQEALEEAVKQLEAHDRSRLQFISNVSHELRTPLTSMIYAIRNMLKGIAGPVSDGVRNYLELLNGDCKRLLNTVNDILDLRKIDTHTLTLAKSKVHLPRLVRQSTESLLIQMEQKFQKLNMRVGNGRQFVECDAQKIERVIVNIVSNSIKFTPEGGEIDVWVGEDNLQPGWIRLTIRDTGIGIPQWALPRVTERYFTVGEQPSGSGLGLAIAREIVELHGGHMKIESPPEGYSYGTAVHLLLTAIDAPTIMVVDDDEEILALMQRQLISHGYCVISARNGNEVLYKIEEVHPDLLVLDMVLPGMDGSEIILKLKANKQYRRLPIIVITGANLDAVKTEILRGFSIPVLTKPWVENEFLEKIEKAFLGVAAIASI